MICPTIATTEYLLGGTMKLHDRRALLKFLAASPLLAQLPSTNASADEPALASAADALDVFDLEAAAQKQVPLAHWGYLQSGVDGEVTLRANASGIRSIPAQSAAPGGRESRGFEHRGVRDAGRFAYFLLPDRALRSFHPEGEVAVARAARAKNGIMVMSTQASLGVEEVTAARGAPIWFQLYTTDRFEATKKLVKRAEAAGCPVVAVTVDLPAGRNTETAIRSRRADTRTCSACHVVDERGSPRTPLASRPMFGGSRLKGWPAPHLRSPGISSSVSRTPPA